MDDGQATDDRPTAHDDGHSDSDDDAAPAAKMALGPVKTQLSSRASAFSIAALMARDHDDTMTGAPGMTTDHGDTATGPPGMATDHGDTATGVPVTATDHGDMVTAPPVMATDHGDTATGAPVATPLGK